MSRSKWKGLYICFDSDFFLSSEYKFKNTRSFVISRKLLNQNIFLHNGRFFKKFLINSNFLGQKMGNLFLTRFFIDRESLKKRFKKR